MWDGVIETRDFVKHTIQNARFRKTHTSRNELNLFVQLIFAIMTCFKEENLPTNHKTPTIVGVCFFGMK